MSSPNIEKKAAIAAITMRIKAVDIDGRPMFYDAQMVRLRSYRDTAVELSNEGYFDENQRYHEAFPEWQSSKCRKTYDGLCFHPTAPGASADLPADRRNHINMWKGWTVKPAKAAGTYDRLMELIRYGLCEESEEFVPHVMAWFGHMVQQSAELPGTALVMHGPQGIGKDTIYDAFSGLCADHSVMLDDTEQLTGQFNGHLAGKLVVFANEACWSRSKAARGRLKSLITSARIQVNEKFKPMYTAENKARLIVATNEDAAAPVEIGDRRFMVFKFGDRYKEDREFFGELRRELDNGGREALLYDLAKMDLSSMPDPRVVPRTKARMAQQALHLDSVRAFALNALESGEIVSRPTFRYADGWSKYVAVSDLLDSYEKYARQHGDKFPADQRALLKSLEALLGLGKSRTTRLTSHSGETSKPRVRRLPILEESAKAFKAETGITPDLPNMTTFDASTMDAEDDDDECMPVDLTAYRNKFSTGMTGENNG